MVGDRGDGGDGDDVGDDVVAGVGGDAMKCPRAGPSALQASCAEADEMECSALAQRDGV